MKPAPSVPALSVLVKGLLAGVLGLMLVGSGAALAAPTPEATSEAGPDTASGLPPGSDPIGDVLSGIAAAQGMDDDDAEDTPQSTVPTTPAPGDTDPNASDPVDSISGSATAETLRDALSLRGPQTPGASAPAQAYSLPPRSAPQPQPQPQPMPVYRPPPPIVRTPQLDRPVMIDELSRTPEPPPSAVEQAYENRIRGGFNAAQGLQGPLDGNWILRGSDGRTLYSLQLVDKGTGGQPLQGAWRSLRSDRPAGGVGLVDTIDRTPTGVDVRFTPRGAREALVLTLTPSGGGWAGEMWEAGSTRQVTMRRN
jgi:hypothetical protein